MPSRRNRATLLSLSPRADSKHHQSLMNLLAPTRVRWILVGWIALMGASAFLDRVNISIAAHFISQDFHLSDVQLGKIFSAFFVGYGLFQIAGGWAVDRLGARRTLALGAAWWAAFTALTASFPAGIAQAFLIIWSVRFLLGMGESVMYPSSNRWVANWIPTAERGLANGLIFAGVGAGSAFTPPIIRYVMVHLGWRASFWVCAFLGLAAGAVWYWMARDHPDQHSWPNDAERKWIHQGIPQCDPIEAPHYSWRVMLASQDVWAISLSYFCYGYTPAIFFTWFFIYLSRVRGLNLQTASYYGMLPFIAMAWDRRRVGGLPMPCAGDSADGGGAAAWQPAAWWSPASLWPRVRKSLPRHQPAWSWQRAPVLSTSRKALIGRSPPTWERDPPARSPASSTCLHRRAAPSRRLPHRPLPHTLDGPLPF